MTREKTYCSALLILLLVVTANAQSRGEDSPSVSNLKANGAFGFPQQEAMVMFSDKELRVSVTYNSNYLFIQAIVWNDEDSSIGKDSKGSDIGDYSALMFHLGSCDTHSPKVDKIYFLNPRPSAPGLHVSTILSANAPKITFPERVSKGGGSIQYIDTTEKVRVRVDSYVVPLKDLGKHKGDKVRLCYAGYSFKPQLRVNSAGHKTASYSWYWTIPISMYQEVLLDKDVNV